MNSTMFKRLLSVVMVLAMLMSYVVMPAAAETTQEQPEHSHDYVAGEVVAATCTVDGYTVFTCECGHSYQGNVVAAAGAHSYSDGNITRDATCQVKGELTYTCGVCGNTYTEETDFGDHNYADGVCLVCGEAAPACTGAQDCTVAPHGSECLSQCTGSVDCVNGAHNEGCLSQQPKETEPAETQPPVCDGTENCPAQTHETTCPAYDWCAALGCTPEAHHADCPWGPCAKTPGCELVKDHPGDCTGAALFDAATDLAKIGTIGYATLAAAIAAANDMTGDVTVEIYGKTEYTDDTASLTGSYDSISFVGKDTDAEISITRDGSAGYISGVNNDCTVNFSDLKLSKASGEFVNDAGFMNVYFTVYRVGAVNYTNCTFPDGACAAGCPTSYTKCTFANDNDGNYNLWVYGNVACTVDQCTFNGIRGAKMYAEGHSNPNNSLILKNSTFTSTVTQKPAIVLTYGESVTLSDNTYSSTGVFELDKDGSPNGTAVAADIADLACKNDDYEDCGVLVDGKIYTTITDAASAITSSSTVTLMYATVETVDLPYGATLNTNGYTAENIASKLDTEAELRAALAAGGTVTLEGDITLTSVIEISNAVVLNLNGYKMEADWTADASTGNDALLCVKYGGDLTINGEGSITNGNTNVYAAVKMTQKGETANGTPTKLTVNGGTLQGYYYAVSGNGSRNGTEITIHGGSLTAASAAGLAIFHPQQGTLTIDGGTLTGTNAGVEMRGGTLNLTGGTVTSTYTGDPKIEGNGSGATVYGAAVGVSQHSTNLDISVNISGSASLVGPYALWEKDVQKPGEGVIKMSVTGGTFNGKVESENVDGYITGGTINGDVAEGDIKFGFAKNTENKIVETRIENTVEAPKAETSETVQGSNDNTVNAAATSVTSNTANNTEEVKKSIDTAISDETVDSIVKSMENTAGATEVKVTVDIFLSAVHTDNSSVTKLTYEIEPQVQITKTTTGDSAAAETEVVTKKIENNQITDYITVCIPIPASVTAGFANVYHESAFFGAFPVEGEGNDKHVKIQTKEFSTWDVVPLSDDVTVLEAEVNGTKYATLKEAIEKAPNGSTIKLLENVDIAGALVNISNVTLDLNGKTLTMNGESSTISGSTIKNGRIEITKQDGDSVADGLFDVNGNTIVENVTFHSDDFALYAIFDIKSGDLTMTGCTIDMANNVVGGNGGLIFFNDNGTSKLTMNSCTVTATDVGDFISNGTAELNNCTITLKGTKKDGLDNGINGTALTLNNTILTVDGATGRGLTSDGDDINITGTSVVTLTNCAEAGIRFKEQAEVKVAETAALNAESVTVDSGAGGSIVANTVLVETQEGEPAVSISKEANKPQAQPAAAVIMVDGYYYTDMTKALAKIAEGGEHTVKLLKNITLSETLEISNTLTLDLNGKTLTGTITVAENGNLTLQDSGENGAITYQDGYQVLRTDGGSLTILGGTLTGENAVYATGGSVTVKGGTLNAEDGRAIDAEKAEVTVSGGTLNAKAFAIVAENAKVTVSGGTLNAEDSTIYTVNTTVTVSGGELTSGSYGFYLDDNSNLTISNGSITAEELAVFVRNSKAVISGGTLVSNQGDGVATDNGDLTISGANTAITAQAAAVNIGSGKASISGGKFTATRAPAVIASNGIGGFITGGEFTSPYALEDALAKENHRFVLKSGTKNTYVLAEKDYHWIGGDKVYAEGDMTALETALRAGKDGSTITMTKSDSIDGYYPTANDLTIDAAGFNISGKASVEAEGATIEFKNVGANKIGFTLLPGYRANFTGTGVIIVPAFNSGRHYSEPVQYAIGASKYTAFAEDGNVGFQLDWTMKTWEGIKPVMFISAPSTGNGYPGIGMGSGSTSALDYEVFAGTHSIFIYDGMARMDPVTGRPLYTSSWYKDSGADVLMKGEGFYNAVTGLTIYNSNGSVYAKDPHKISKYITVTRGCTAVTLESEYLQAMPNGTYYVVVTYADGEADQDTLIIKAAPSTSTADTTNPKTGDTIFLAVTVMTITAAALALLLIANKRRKRF